MRFSIPTFSRYLFSLAIIAVIALLIYLSAEVTGFNHINPIIALTIGLFLGQLTAFFTPSKTSSSSTSSSLSSDENEEDIITLYVGNIAYNANRNELEQFVSQFGDVHSARIMTDRQTRKPRGYGFIEVYAGQADNMIKDLEGIQFKGRTLKVNRANKKTET